MSLDRKVLEYLYNERINPPKRYESLRLGIFSMLVDEGYKYQSLANRATFLKQKGYIRKNKDGHYFITDKGVDFLENYKPPLRDIELNVDTRAPKNLIVIYDIPQDQKKERDWFRHHLRKLNFKMIQKSVWVGPSPLPKEFLDYVSEVGLKSTFKTFKLSKPYKEK